MSSEHPYEAWHAEEPSEGFAERVMDAAMRQGQLVAPAPRARTRWLAAGLTASAATVLLAWGLLHGPSGKGEHVARERTELEIGRRAVAVLEPGAHLRWDGELVIQEAGDVFYRVDRGSAQLVVRTSAGDVAVRGTAFRVNLHRDVSMARVGVYEGRVELARDVEHLPLGAGEAAELGPSGMRRMGGLADVERFAPESTPDLLGAAANQNLADAVQEYKRRLEHIEVEKRALQKELDVAQQKLERTGPDGAALPRKSEFDLAPEDWAELARTGTVKYRTPCREPGKWAPRQEVLDQHGLSPTDVTVLRDAYLRSSARTWARIKPLCAAATGSDTLADKLGSGTCPVFILEVARAADSEKAAEAMRQVGEIRARQRAAPAPEISADPVLRMFLILTEESSLLEADLARSVGPEEAHRLTMLEGLGCEERNRFGGPGPRPPR